MHLAHSQPTSLSFNASINFLLQDEDQNAFEKNVFVIAIYKTNTVLILISKIDQWR